jgi:hypothetical protein
VLHSACAEAAVVGYEHPIKGQGIYAYVTLMDGVEYSDEIQKELVLCAPSRNQVPWRGCRSLAGSRVQNYQKYFFCACLVVS